MTARPDFLTWFGRAAEPGERVRLAAEESRHLVKVLRKPAEAPVALADGDGGWLIGRLTDPSQRSAEVAIDSVVPSDAEPRHPLEMAVSPLRTARTEWLLEKGTELGVTRFTLIRSARSRPTGVRLDRWERLVRSAAMQCLRSKPPEINPVTDLTEWLSGIEDGVRRFAGRPGGDADPEGGDTPAAALVGPEGDLTEAEWSAVSDAGFRFVDLGRARLRAETAAVALVARITARAGD